MKDGTAYSYDEKITIIREHEEEHRTLLQIVDKYGISKSYLCYLLKQYRENGAKSIMATQYYTREYKLGVVKRHYEDGLSVAELVKETGIQHRMVKEWLSRYAKEGYAGLSTRQRGRPKRIEANTPEERIRQLEMENEVLRSFREECERWDANK
jgi:transposase-like protein